MSEEKPSNLMEIIRDFADKNDRSRRDEVVRVAKKYLDLTESQIEAKLTRYKAENEIWEKEGKIILGQAPAHIDNPSDEYDFSSVLEVVKYLADVFEDGAKHEDVVEIAAAALEKSSYEIEVKITDLRHRGHIYEASDHRYRAT